MTSGQRWPDSQHQRSEKKFLFNRSTQILIPTHSENEYNEDDLQRDADLPQGLQLIPLIGHQISPPHGDSAVLVAAGGVAAATAGSAAAAADGV